jgi:hypothetical protein
MPVWRAATGDAQHSECRGRLSVLASGRGGFIRIENRAGEPVRPGVRIPPISESGFGTSFAFGTETSVNQSFAFTVHG